MVIHRAVRAITGAIVLCAMLAQATGTLAGTTGSLSGVVVESGTQTPISGALVTATSPSQQTSAQTDSTGHFSFVSLAPDTYDVSVSKSGYEKISQSGVSVFADQTQTLTLSAPKALREIGQVTSRAVGDLVKSGTTADVYSVNAAQSQRVAALGGGGGLNNAYSAIASVPGAYVPLNQNGYYQTVHIRGGDYDAVGYEVDGVPVNRSFDNYPAGTASSLGQQELQVYTGASPASSEGQGLAGYINQVIKTGTYPGFGDIAVAVGGPQFYHKLSAEAGGATPNRNFSYYLGLGGYNNDNFEFIDANNGGNFVTNNYGTVIGCASSGPGCGSFGATYLMAPLTAFANSGLADRDVVGNFHIGLPHKYDSGKDDIQILFNSQLLKTSFYDSTNDIGNSVYAAQGFGLPSYTDGLFYNGPIDQLLPASPAAQFANTSVYLFPSSPSSRCANVTSGFATPFVNQCPAGTVALVDPNLRDSIYNDQQIFKLQYQKNFTSNAYLRLYGYAYYSDWLQTGPQSAFANYFGPVGPDYELETHTRGGSASFVDQINSKNLLTLQGSITSANSVRDNNRTFYDTLGIAGARPTYAVLVDPNNKDAGICYSLNPAGPVAIQATCNPGKAFANQPGGATFATLGNPAPDATGQICGTGPCAYNVVENGYAYLYNTVKPTFSALSITDQFRPTDKLLLNLGLRDDSFKFEGAPTSGGARQFWFNAFNNESCVDPGTGQYADMTTIGTGTLGQTCTSITAPSGKQYQATNLQNVSGQTFTYSVLQPRISGTYTVNPDTVLRASFGKYVEPPNAAYEQYSAHDQDLAYLLANRFYKYGFNTPGHQVRPPVSYNADFSLEKHLHGSDWSFKLTPYYRKTKDQIQNFFLDQRTGFVSGLNVGEQTTDGFELAVNKGDFARNGFAGQLAFTYTNAFIKYNKLPNGTSIVSQINGDIATYNGYTKACNADALAHGGTPSNAACGANSAASAPCYTTTGTPDPACAATSIGNPYWGAPIASTLDTNGSYVPYDIFPGPVGSSADSFIVPYVATLVLNYKHDKLAITPSFQFAAGNRYGAPESVPGIDPAAGCSALAPATANDPRYPWGNPGANSYDATTCAGTLAAIPDPFTKQFDNLGAFRNPSQLVANLQITYDLSKQVTLTGTFANIINRCFGGQIVGNAYSSKDVCSYGIVGSAAGGIAPYGNVYNPGAVYDAAPAFLKTPYEPTFGPVNVNGNSTKQPFQFYIQANIKL